MPSYEEWKKECWDRSHKEEDVSALTGTGIGGHLHTLKVKDLIQPDMSVLCIGVGTGGWIQEMSETVKEVWALDVTEFAAKNLPSKVVFTTDAKELPNNHFDLALSLWVASHMSNHDLQLQFEGVIPSLKPNGIFAVHYKEPLDASLPLDNLEGTEDEWKKARSATVMRRRGHFNEMVEWVGGRVSKTFGDDISVFYQIVEAVAHIQRRVV